MPYLRFVSSTSATLLVQCCTNVLALLAAVSGPVLVIAFFLITTNGEEEQIQQEFWFGAEVCVYIICPLLALTVFGTVNCCKVSMTSRLLPSYQIQAIKLNIGVTICTNVAMFIFLVQVIMEKPVILSIIIIIIIRNLFIFGSLNFR